jgi:hypothetical protein
VDGQAIEGNLVPLPINDNQIVTVRATLK